jgi:hypothetical protein
LPLLCKAFSVNPAWLRDGTGPMFLEPPQTADLEADNQEVLALYNSLNPEFRTFVRKVLKNLLEIDRDS